MLSVVSLLIDAPTLSGVEPNHLAPLDKRFLSL